MIAVVRSNNSEWIECALVELKLEDPTDRIQKEYTSRCHTVVLVQSMKTIAARTLLNLVIPLSVVLGMHMLGLSREEIPPLEGTQNKIEDPKKVEEA